MTEALGHLRAQRQRVVVVQDVLRVLEPVRELRVEVAAPLFHAADLDRQVRAHATQDEEIRELLRRLLGLVGDLGQPALLAQDGVELADGDGTALPGLGVLAHAPRLARQHLRPL